MNNNRFLLFAQIANITYNEPKTARKEFHNLGYILIQFLDCNGAQAYIIENNSEMIISFRGTEITEKSDIIADLKIIKEKDIVGYVHKGFKNEVDKLWNSLSTIININNKPLFLTGHSLGAAMATIFASRIKTSVTALVTFGSPRVGDSNFVNNLDVIHYRVKNSNDIITKLPLESMGYKHHGKCIYLNYYGVICELTTVQYYVDVFRSHIYNLYKCQFFNGIRDHSLDNYIEKFTKIRLE